jgi:NADPH-dependent 2,4-dienoyl-CoA reductase/sulfur reductase-like enzyme/rhodanese-related sulfurtransferase
MAEKKRVVIVGGVAGGASTAARARRLSEDAEIVMFERGDYISFANCGLPYHIGGVILERDKLFVQTPDGLRRRFKIDVRTGTEVTAIDRKAKKVSFRELKTGKEGSVTYDVLVLSPGAEPVRPRLPGVDSRRVFTLRNIPDTDRIKELIDRERTRKAVVIGGGYIGMEMTDALVSRGAEVVLVEALPQVMNFIDPEMAYFIHQHLVAKGVDLRLKTAVTEISEQADKLSIKMSDGRSVDAELAIMAVGVKPEIKLAREAGLEIGSLGGVVVDEHMRTSDPDIFAVGDAVETVHFVSGKSTYVPLAGPANRQARIAADNIFGRDSAYRKTQGTAICKIFDLAVACTGLNEKSLKAQKIPYEKIYLHPLSHANYFPGSAMITIKLLFGPTDGRILGCQALGADGVDKRIDVIATAMRGGMTVLDLEHLELCYSPQYGSAKDPVNLAGYVASNVLRGDVQLFHSEEAMSPRADQFLLDSRTPAEFKRGTIPGAVNIPVDDLRDRLGEIPRDKEILVFCQAGLRGYLACNMLRQNGFNCRNLTGGYKIYQAEAGFLAGK